MDPKYQIANLLGTPEVKISLTTETVIKFFFALVAAMVLIFIARELFKSK